MLPWVLLAASYLLGAIPSSHIGGLLLRGLDLRRHGSGNLGATNAFRVLGWKVALPVLLFDIFKGWFPTFAFPMWDRVAPAAWAGGGWAFAYGCAAIVGHVFSPYVAFKGGKGVATSSGMLLALAPWGLLAGFLTWITLVWSTRIVSLSSVIAAAVVPLVVALVYGVGAVFWLCVGVALFVVFAHRSNLKRLARGEEARFGRKAGEMPGPGVRP
ncbi:MAG TPA: glycerol-3-phosphate 1-O-acyltransferase PlsY [Longimicrobiales bacterium]|nr:glycerol-3-phosphate 1-O-acyltransferase PlsY [Longimicrobiales bacterium]